MANQEKPEDQIVQKKMEMDSLLSFLVKPVQELEKKYKDQQEYFQAQIAEIKTQFDKIGKEFLRYSEEFARVSSKPDKLEHRISACEGKVKKVEPLEVSLSEAKERAVSVESSVKELEFSSKNHKAELEDLKKQNKELRDHLAELERKQKDLHENADIMHRSIKSMEREIPHNKRIASEAVQNVDQACKREIDSYLKEIKKDREYLQDLNIKIEQNWKDANDMIMKAKETFDLQLQEKLKEFPVLRDMLKEVKENVDIKLYRDDDKIEALSKSLEFLEKRADKMSLALKEVKSELKI